MTKTIQLLRGTTAQNDAFTGAAGEVTVDTQTHELRVHDGSTVSGFIIPTKSEMQSALSGKQATITGAATSITSSNLTADMALVSDSNGKVAVSSITSTELGYLSGVTSNIATQLSNKVTKGHELIAYQNPTSSNNYTWYRKYADGWVEQGGVVTGTGYTNYANFPITMSNTNYTGLATTADIERNDGIYMEIAIYQRNTTNMRITATYGQQRLYQFPICWYVAGIAAS